MFPDPYSDILPLHVYAAVQSGHATEQLFKGIKKYVSHPYRSKHKWPSTDIWSHTSTSLYYYPSTNKEGVKSRVFLVPSLINGAEIFDLIPEYSFINFLNRQGMDIYLLNWTNSALPADYSLQMLIDEILVKSYIAACNHAQHSLHIMGHCLGGSILLSGLSKIARIQTPLSLTLLATPLDFHTSDAPWHRYLPHLERIKKVIRANGKLSQTMMQSFFGQISPKAVIEKYVDFLDWGEDSLKSRLFVKVEDWLNNGEDLPPILALEIFDTFFIQNNTEQLPSYPTLIITSENDLVVPSSAAAPQHCIQNKRNIELILAKSGHLGMMASANARNDIWSPISTHVLSVEDNTAPQQH